ncbi:MAG: alpha/beta fold hydrolase [Deltaproteobacteria bacterium]|nr:alpha/beta fold hydrolase [Deltaproteobacteria bacterium]
MFSFFVSAIFPAQPSRGNEARAANASKNKEYPVIFVHGFAGYGKLALLSSYFEGLEEAIAARAEEGEPAVAVFMPDLPPFAPSEVRAPLLAAEIARVLEVTGAKKVHLVAHSLGGIDARKAIADFSLEDKVFSLTTFATPHHGTIVASTFQVLPEWMLLSVFAPMDIFYDVMRGHSVGPIQVQKALTQMSPATMAAFNRNYPPPRGVFLFSIAGVTSHSSTSCDGPWGKPQFQDAPIPFILPTYLWLRGAPTDATANDGVVAVISARWEGFLGCVPADHFDEVGKGAELFASLDSKVLDHHDFYFRYIKRLQKLAQTEDVAIIEAPFPLLTR